MNKEWAQHGRGVTADPAGADTYHRWAPFYDLVFDWPFHPGRLAAANAAAQVTPPNGKLLVAGVGTGLELDLLPRNLQVTGIDLARPMLDVARRRVAHKRLSHVVALRVMDAGALEFEDDSLDTVLAPYLMSVVADPARVLTDMWRVTRPGGHLVILNHFAAERGLRARLERTLDGAGSWLGWHPNFPYAAVGDWLKAQPDATLLESRAVAPLRLFTLLRVKKGA
ncbi:class I SAM-dependent methyltransferase [Methylovirgula sp. 4M-Z18]|uniref:class I SAM-dependent methyltransferase n=1 Tax=Methylovirgula sp. 4M-Z18 TaxID=2293567 RepID=UPI000E2ECB77|nr:class I SAM-dependent methyltransferase [Methylovirgula sp. 4M-Z18]RFB80882.1 class I SAM-dependent methyltransferase [Methylovirgula sp. 4M-Z18]